MAIFSNASVLHHFTLIPNDVFNDGELSSTQTLVLLVLHMMTMQASGPCCPTVEEISNAARLSRRGTLRALSALEELGYIKRTPRKDEYGGSDSNMYTIIQKRKEVI